MWRSPRTAGSSPVQGLTTRFVCGTARLASEWRVHGPSPLCDALAQTKTWTASHNLGSLQHSEATLPPSTVSAGRRTRECW